MFCSIKHVRSFIREALIVESKKSDLIKNNPELSDDIELFAQQLENTNSKYLEWQVKMLKKGVEPDKLHKLVKSFDRFGQKLDKKDINSYGVNDLTLLQNELDKFDKISSEKQQAKFEVAEGSKTVYDSDDFIVRLITNKASSIHHGKDTKWCITMQDKSHFEEYSMNNCVFFFIFNKLIKDTRDPSAKIALSYQRGLENELLKLEIFLSDDKLVDESSLKQMLGAEFNEIINTCNNLAKKQPKSLLAKLKNNGKLTNDEFAKLAEDKDKKVRTLVAANTFTPIQLLTKLAKDENEDIRRAVAGNHSTPEHTLTMLVTEKDPYIRRSAARNPSTPERLLTMLVIDKDRDVRRSIAENPSTPEHTLTILATDEDFYVRYNVAKNPSTPERTLKMIATTDKLID